MPKTKVPISGRWYNPMYTMNVRLEGTIHLSPRAFLKIAKDIRALGLDSKKDFRAFVYEDAKSAFTFTIDRACPEPQWNFPDELIALLGVRKDLPGTDAVIYATDELNADCLGVFYVRPGEVTYLGARIPDGGEAAMWVSVL